MINSYYFADDALQRGRQALTDEDYHYLYYGYAHRELQTDGGEPDLDKLMLASGLDPDNRWPKRSTRCSWAKIRSPRPVQPKILNLMAYAHGALGNKLQEKM